MLYAVKAVLLAVVVWIALALLLAGLWWFLTTPIPPHTYHVFIMH